MNNKLLFETMDITEADLVKWVLDEHEINYQITGRSVVTEFQAVPIQLFVSEVDFQRAYDLCKSKNLLKIKGKTRKYKIEEKQWLYYLASTFPVLMICSLIVSEVNTLMLLTIIYIAFGYILYQRYKKSRQ